MPFGKHSSKIKESKIALDSRIEQHDRSQFEVKFDYNFLHTLKKSEKKKHKKDYSIEAYFFIPHNMGVTSFNYSKTQFYNDLHAYIRFRTPAMSYNEINDENNIHSPLRILRVNLDKLKIKPSEELSEVSINEAKLFGCLINSFLNEGTVQIRKLINQGIYYRSLSKSEFFINTLENEIKNYINDTLHIYYKFRSIRKEYESLRNLDESLGTNLKLVDEYNTYRLENSFAKIYGEIDNLSKLKGIECQNIINFLTQVAHKESQYRIKEGFICFKNSTSVSYEYYSYRFSAIKKHIFQVLYLDVRQIRNEKKYRNMMAMIGAAMAALAYYPAQVMAAGGAATSYSVILLVVIAYIFKDRVKEISREYFIENMLGRLHHYFPDNDLFIQDYTQSRDKNSKENIIGRCKEFMQYIDKEKVEDDIMFIRNFGHIVDIDEEKNEVVIFYKKDVSLSSHKIIHSHHRRTNIKDIIRFNISDFLSKLDNPTGKIYFYDMEKNLFSNFKAPKVYHLNIVFKYTLKDKKNDTSTYQRIRVVLDKDGIVRIDEVVPRSKYDPFNGEITEEKIEEDEFIIQPEDSTKINYKL